MADNFKFLDDDWHNFTSVSEAESMTYSQPCVVSVKDTGRVYQFDLASTATRDGIRVLTPAGGGRLLASKTGSDDVEIPKIGTPDHQSLTQSLQVGLSTGACNGDFVVDAGGGTINIAAGEGMIRAVNSSDSPIFAFHWPAVNGVAIPQDSVRYVGVEYNSGSPQAVVRTTNNWNGQTEFQAATVVNEGGTLHIFNNPQESCDGIQKIFHRLIETQPFQFAERIGGGRFSEVGTRNLSLSPCEFYDGLNEFAITIKNTSTGDTFDSYYGSFTKVASQTQWDNQNYDNAGTLTALSANRYGVHWLYIEMDDSFALVYGKGNYNTISDAEAALPPTSLPLRLSLGSRLAAKLIFQKGASSVIQIESAFDVNFKSGMPVSHGDLSNINGNGDYHLSESERDAATRIATASQSGLMSAEQAAKLDNLWTVWDEENFAPEFTAISYKLSSKYEGGGTLTYTGGRGVYNSGSSPFVAVYNSGGMRFQDCAGKAVFKLENSGSSFSGTFRYDNGANGDMYRVRIVPGSPGTIYLERLDAWSSTTLDSASVNIALNTDYTLIFKAIGSNLSAEVNGVTVSATDSNYTEGTMEFQIYLDIAATQGGSFGYYGIYTPVKTL